MPCAWPAPLRSKRRRKGYKGKESSTSDIVDTLFNWSQDLPKVGNYIILAKLLVALVAVSHLAPRALFVVSHLCKHKKKEEEPRNSKRRFTYVMSSLSLSLRYHQHMQAARLEIHRYEMGDGMSCGWRPRKACKGSKRVIKNYYSVLLLSCAGSMQDFTKLGCCSRKYQEAHASGFLKSPPVSLLAFGLHCTQKKIYITSKDNFLA